MITVEQQIVSWIEENIVSMNEREVERFIFFLKENFVINRKDNE